MVFFVDSQDFSVTAFSGFGDAARHVLKKLGIVPDPALDVMRQAREAVGDRGVFQNLSDAFEAVAASDDSSAQELAQKYADALGVYFSTRPGKVRRR